MLKQKFNTCRFKSSAITIGRILFLVSCFGIWCYMSKICNYYSYEHLEYDKIISIDYKFFHTHDHNNSEYWTTGCVYTLQAKDINLIPHRYHRTKIEVMIDHKFSTKKQAVATLYCAGEDSINNIISLYYPTRGYEFDITLPDEITNDKCDCFKETKLTKNYRKIYQDIGTEIIFDPYIVYGVNSKDYYEKYMNDKLSEDKNIISAVIKLICCFFSFSLGFLLTNIEEWCFSDKIIK